jgi:L-amino acid N-acyltransferase YncA
MLALQQRNLPQNITKAEAQEQGFVTVEHDEDLLWEMNQKYPHTIAMADDKIVGYALVMTQNFKHRIPILLPMFAQIDKLAYQGKSLSAYRYFIMGQVCIDKAFRGKGIFKGLYQAMGEQLKNDFDFIITEVSHRNTRSLRAHEKVGFKTLLDYQSPDGEHWKMIILTLS